MIQPAANRRGIIATLVACALWTVNDACGKLASEVFPTGQMMAVRGVFAIAIAVSMVVWTGHGRMLWRDARLVLRPVVLLRAVLDATVVLCFYKALPHMQLADITAISQATPIIMTVMAAALGIEVFGWRRLIAILVGFFGVLLVVKPSAAGLSIYAMYAVLSAAMVAGRDLLTRYIDPAIPSPVIALATAITGAVTGLGMGLGENWQPIFTPPTFYLVVAGIIVTLGNLLIVIAYRDAEVAVVAPFRYSSILTALVLGFAIFGNLPDRISVAGILLIMASGVYTIHREHVRRKEAEARQSKTAIVKVSGEKSLRDAA
jgi:drug/metabolite transporter (DMT)-like permease